MIGEAELRAMQPTAYLINTSRGALIDEAALVRALSEGWIAGAALDVLVEEPARPDQPLLALDNAIVTPHAAFYSESAIKELVTKAARNVASVLRGEVPASSSTRRYSPARPIDWRPASAASRVGCCGCGGRRCPGRSAA